MTCSAEGCGQGRRGGREGEEKGRGRGEEGRVGKRGEEREGEWRRGERERGRMWGGKKRKDITVPLLQSFYCSATPPTSLRPEPVQIQSTFIEVRWTPPPCTGGHYIIGYTIRYKEVLNVSTDYHYIFNINQTAAKYTIGQLKPSSTYLISVQSTDARFATSPFSYENTIATLPPGKQRARGWGKVRVC